MSNINGILNILKPPGMTSFDVVGYLKPILKTGKIGHTGTLDPGAVGVLPICIGNATKAIEYMTENSKVYRAELTLGVSTDTQDWTGNILKTCEINVSDIQISEAVKSFIGKYSQIPPMYSAIKINGKKLYELARKGIEIERKPRALEIYWIDIIHLKNDKVIFDVACSKGTYIRTLCSDIGDKLGCGGHMSFLLRLKAGAFHLDSSITLEEVRNMIDNNKLNEELIAVDEVFKAYKEVVVNEVEEKKILNGVSIRLLDNYYEDGETIRIYDRNKKFFSIGEFTSINGVGQLKSKKLFL